MYEGQIRPDKIVSADSEAWVLERLLSFAELTRKITMHQTIGADRPMVVKAIEGAANGVAAEIIRNLGLEPSFINIRR